MTITLTDIFYPGYFSHAGLYVGKVAEDDKKLIKTREGEKLFRTGSQM